MPLTSVCLGLGFDAVFQVLVKDKMNLLDITWGNGAAAVQNVAQETLSHVLEWHFLYSGRRCEHLDACMFIKQQGIACVN